MLPSKALGENMIGTYALADLIQVIDNGLGV
jgi:hypothetical protein